ncbi:unnamed protein product, partial [Prunus brigantina]
VSLLRDRHRACQLVGLTSCTSLLPRVGVEWLSGSRIGFIVVEIEDLAISGKFVEGAKVIFDQGFHDEGNFRGCPEGGDDFRWWSKQWLRFPASLYGCNNKGAESEGIVEGLIEEGRVGVEKQLVSSEGGVYREMERNYVMLEVVSNQLEKLKIEYGVPDSVGLRLPTSIDAVRYPPKRYVTRSSVKYNSLSKDKEDEVELVTPVHLFELGLLSDNGGEVTKGGEDTRGEEAKGIEGVAEEAEDCTAGKLQWDDDDELVAPALDKWMKGLEAAIGDVMSDELGVPFFTWNPYRSFC